MGGGVPLEKEKTKKKKTNREKISINHLTNIESDFESPLRHRNKQYEVRNDDKRVGETICLCTAKWNNRSTRLICGGVYTKFNVSCRRDVCGCLLFLT